MKKLLGFCSRNVEYILLSIVAIISVWAMMNTAVAKADWIDDMRNQSMIQNSTQIVEMDVDFSKTTDANNANGIVILKDKLGKCMEFQITNNELTGTKKCGTDNWNPYDNSKSKTLMKSTRKTRKFQNTIQ